MQNDSPTHEKTLNKKDDTRGKTMTIPEADDEEEIGKGNDLIEDSATGSSLRMLYLHTAIKGCRFAFVYFYLHDEYFLTCLCFCEDMHHNILNMS